MKSEHRHDLQTNDLAKSLMTFPDYVREYGGRVALGLAIVVLAVILIMQRTNRSQAESIRYRDDLAFARTVIERVSNAGVNFQGGTTFDPGNPAIGDARRRLRDVRENASDKAVLAQALLAQGDLAWALGNFPEPSTASTQPAPKLEKERPEFQADAKTAYQQIVSQYPDQTIPFLASHFGLAAIAENARNWDEARKEYQIVKDHPEAIESYKRLADRQLKALDDLRHPVLIGQVPDKLELPTPPNTLTPSTAPSSQATTRPTTTPTAATTRPTK
jgi:tetratricopeptide (TPR) repeat protein